MRLGISTHAALTWLLWPFQSPHQADDSISFDCEPSAISLSDTWQVLGPFQLGTRESIWGADPLERQGGFRKLQYDAKASFKSALAANGSVGWSIASAHRSSSSDNQDCGWYMAGQLSSVEPVDIISIYPSKACHHLRLEKPVKLHGYQTRPLVFTVTLRDAKETNFSVKVRYRTANEAIRSSGFEVYVQARSLIDPQRVTYLHPSGIVSYAIIRPPPLSCTDTGDIMPILVALHGAGLEADSVQAREMLDAAYGICAWMITPSGVTSWSGDDWHHWGTADTQAAISAIPDWASSVGWKGPIPSQDNLIVTGHSNGGQGAWYFSTHYPDRVVAVAPISGYSSIENYVPYTMWHLCEPLLSSVIQRSKSTYKHELLLSNLAGIPIAQQHGSDDDNVPVYHARLMHTILDQIQLPSIYDEMPGKGHWFEGVMTTSFLTNFYRAMVNRTKSIGGITSECPMGVCNTTSVEKTPWICKVDAATFTITVPASGNMGSKAGIQVDQLLSPDVNGRLRVYCDPFTSIWHIRTYNIYRFHLSGDNPRVKLPAAIVLDGLEKPFLVDPAHLHQTWYSKAVDVGWKVLDNSNWKTLDQRYGHQLGAGDAILRTRGTFAVLMCTPGVGQVALQVSRNLMQYYAADSLIHEDCLDEDVRRQHGNVFILAIGEDLPRSKLSYFPIHTHRGGLVVMGNGDGLSSDELVSRHEYPYEPGLGAIFLRPLENEKLEMVIWGVDLNGLQQAARLAPSLTGSGQAEYVILSDRCRWEGLAGVYSAGHFDRAWQVSSGSYHSVNAGELGKRVRVPS